MTSHIITYLFIIVLSPKFNTAEPLKYPLQDLHVTSPTGHMPPIGTYNSITTICTIIQVLTAIWFAFLFFGIWMRCGWFHSGVGTPV
jgi:hypothetical protein